MKIDEIFVLLGKISLQQCGRRTKFTDIKDSMGRAKKCPYIQCSFIDFRKFIHACAIICLM